MAETGTAGAGSPVPVVKFAHGEPVDACAAILESLRPVKLPPPVYPYYIMARIRDALDARFGDKEGIIDRIVPEGRYTIVTTGDCRHGLTVADVDGNHYLVTIEVVRP